MISLQFHTNERWSKIFACAWSKMGVASLVTELKSLLMLVRIQEGLSRFIHFWVGMVRNSHGFLVHETLKICCTLRTNVWIDLILLMLIAMQ